MSNIAEYRRIADDGQTDLGQRKMGLSTLFLIFSQRNQFSSSADIARKMIGLLKKSGPKYQGELKHWQDQLAQIVGNWGQFEPVADQPTERGANFRWSFRNGNEVTFTAYRVDVEKLLTDIQEKIKSEQGKIDFGRNDYSVSNLGYRLVEKNQKKYRGPEVARWTLPLDPAKGHFNRTITWPVR